MDPRDEDWELPPTVPVEPKPIGRGLPIPPVIPLIAVFSIFIGLGLGYRIAPSPQPTAAPSPLATPTPTPVPAADPTTISVPWPNSSDQSFISIVGPIDVVNPPAEGLTIEQLLAVLAQPGMRIPSSDVISARVARYNQVSSTATESAQWVWVVIVRSSLTWAVNGHECLAAASPGVSVSPDCVVIQTTQIIILDYLTGEFLEAQSWPRA